MSGGRFIETGDEQRAKARRATEEAFAQWLHQVDQHLLRSLGLGHRDLGDQTWRVWFTDQVDPAEAADMALENEGLL